MKVLIAAREYPPYIVGGVATHTERLVKYLRLQGVYVDVLSFGRQAGIVDSPRGRVFFIKPESSIISRSDEGIARDAKVPKDIIRFTAIASKLAEKEDYDIVHVEEPYVGGLIRHRAKVTTIHDTSYGEIRSIISSKILSSYTIRKTIFYLTLGYAMEYASLATSATIIAPSPQVRDELVYVYRFPRSRVHVIPNGVEEPDPSEPSREEAKKLLGLEDKIVVFTTAQHVHRKRLDILIKAAALLQDKWRGKAKIVIGGKGPLTPLLLEQAKRYKLHSDFLEMTGWIPESKLPLYYRAADIFVLTSDYEAGPQTLLEAGIRGCVLVSTRIPFFPALMKNWVDGVLFPPGDYRSLAAILDRLLGDTSLRERLSKNAVEFSKKFTWQRIAFLTLMVYKKVLGRA